MLEWKEVYAWVSGERAPKTTSTDARKDIGILGMLMKAAAWSCDMMSSSM